MAPNAIIEVEIPHSKKSEDLNYFCSSSPNNTHLNRHGLLHNSSGDSVMSLFEGEDIIDFDLTEAEMAEIDEGFGIGSSPVPVLENKTVAPVFNNLEDNSKNLKETSPRIGKVFKDRQTQTRNCPSYTDNTALKDLNYYNQYQNQNLKTIAFNPFIQNQFKGSENHQQFNQVKVKLEKKSYECTLCSKSYTKNQRLKTHLFKHSGYKHHACSACPQKFYTNQKLKKHSLTVHVHGHGKWEKIQNY